MNRLIRRTLLVTAAAACVAGFGTAGQASAATTPATPSAAQCQGGLDPNASLQEVSGWVYCWDTTTAYRSKLTCEDELRGSTGAYYGPYVKASQNSYAACPDKGGTQWLAVAVTWQFK